MSDTPRTDLWLEQHICTPNEDEVSARFARTLERECNEAQDKLEVMTAKALGWQNQAELNARLLIECREKAERYRLEANAMMAKLHELQTYADRLADGLPVGMLPRDVENLREANAGLAEDLQKAKQERDKAISVAERLIEYAHECLVKLESWGHGYQRYEDDMERIREDIAAYNMMKEALK